MISQLQHTLEADVPKDMSGHHITIQAKRTWCDGEWLEYVDYDNGGMPFGGGVVGLTRWTLADGRVLERRYDSRKGGTQPPRIWSSMAACYKSKEEA